MPNPYLGNDDAARYVGYYASSRMQKESVRRLYEDGIQRQQESQRRAEEAVYPSQPRTYRSQKEIDAYVNEMVYAEVFRRQKKLAELELDLYRPPPTRYLTEQDMEQHVRHMYDQQLRRRERRERERMRRLGLEAASTERERLLLQEREINRVREERWRPPSAYMKRDDGKMLLVSELAAIHVERSASPPTPTTETPKRATSRHTDPRRLQELAKPLRVTPKVQKEEDTLMPPFRVLGDVMKSRRGRQ
ncbi:hypothetical protein DQ04_07181000 [Trypanosoma grayi]|uniref:hypothetical protein n=1 Tax=Trypanosoma grayi TaxID=71804 RepID=UPI0004F420E6|nr:hypothetical protein DQ04_07181000 [Trypanosoma grayi]KEG08438.1 hypothetical protein DQ04_07181000 [Trypanosoma grayi]